MGNREDELKKLIEDQYGSIPKFCEVSGIAKSTVYNIFDRGVENTRTKTMDAVYSYVRLREEADAEELGEEEKILVDMFGKLNEKQREAVMSTIRAMVER